MFRTDRILTSTKLIKNFTQISRFLRHLPSALLIAQKSAGLLVLVNAEIFEDLIDCKMRLEEHESRDGFVGCSSHSGKRTFITNCARKVSQAGGSIRDAMSLAVHRNLQTTQRYVDQNAEAQKKLIALICTNW